MSRPPESGSGEPRQTVWSAPRIRGRAGGGSYWHLKGQSPAGGYVSMMLRMGEAELPTVVSYDDSMSYADVLRGERILLLAKDANR